MYFITQCMAAFATASPLFVAVCTGKNVVCTNQLDAFLRTANLPEQSQGK